MFCPLVNFSEDLYNVQKVKQMKMLNDKLFTLSTI